MAANLAGLDAWALEQALAGKPVQPTHLTDPTQRVLTAAFCEEIAARASDLPGDLSFDRVRFDCDIDWSGVHFSHGVSFRSCVLRKLVMTDARIDGRLRFIKTLIADARGERLTVGHDVSLESVDPVEVSPGAKPYLTLNLNNAVIAGRLYLHQVTAQRLSLDALEVGGGVEIATTAIDEMVYLARCQTARYIKLTGLKCATLALHHSRARDSMRLVKVTVTDKLQIDDSAVGADLSLEESAVKAASLVRCFVSGRFSVTNSTCDSITARETTVGRSVEISDTVIRGDLDLAHARVSSDVHVHKGAIEGAFDLSRAVIEGDLCVARGERPVWGEKATLSLRGAELGAIAGKLNDYRRPAGRGDMPLPTDFAGIRFRRAGLTGAGEGAPRDGLGDAPARAIVAWLDARRRADRSRNVFNPQPYAEVARAFALSGQTSKARELEIAARDHELSARNVPLGRKLMLLISSLLIRYGYQNWRAAFLFLVLVLAATGFGLYTVGELRYAPTSAGIENALRWFWYALGNAIPIITLDKAHETFLVDRFAAAGGVPIWAHSVFYLEKLMGFVILTYLAAGISGLSRRSRD